MEKELCIERIEEIQKVLKPLGYEVASYDVTKPQIIELKLWNIIAEQR